MTRLHLSLLALGLLLLTPWSAWGQAPGFGAGGDVGGGPAGAGRPIINPLMQALDSDGDGTLSAREIRAATRALKALDTNKDGQLTPDELAAPGPGAGPGKGPGPADAGKAGAAGGRIPAGAGLPAGRGLPIGGIGTVPGGGIGNAGGIRAGGRGLPLDNRQMRGFDRDGDGVVTQQELPAQLWSLYGRFDLNRDGKLDPAELARAQRANR